MPAHHAASTTKPQPAPVPNRLRIAALARDLLANPATRILDCETDGLKADAHLTEVAVLDTVSPSGWQRFLKTPDTDGPEFPALYPELYDLIAGKVVLTYSAFHERMIVNHCKRYELPQLPVEKWVDVLPLWAEYVGDWDRDAGRWRLQKLPRQGIRAISDCEATRLLMREMAAFGTEPGEKQTVPKSRPVRGGQGDDDGDETEAE